MARDLYEHALGIFPSWDPLDRYDAGASDQLVGVECSRGLARSERLAEGDAIDEAAIGASRDRLRAVLLTSLTTIGGLTPLLFETSRQAQFLMPMAITMVFGLALATFLVLFLVPSLIGIGNDIGSFFRFTTARRTAPSAAAPAE